MFQISRVILSELHKGSGLSVLSVPREGLSSGRTFPVFVFGILAFNSVILKLFRTICLKMEGAEGEGEGSNSRMGEQYKWEPNPYLAAMVGMILRMMILSSFFKVGVLTVIIVLIPAVCSICYHTYRNSEPESKVKILKVKIRYLSNSYLKWQ